MKFPALAVAVLLGACASPVVAPGGPALSPSLFPLEPAAREYVLQNGVAQIVRFVPDGAGGGAIRMGDEPSGPRIDVSADATGVRFSAEIGSSTEVLRFGAKPGDRWASGATTLFFEGWERIQLPAGTYDAARVTSTLSAGGDSGGAVRQDETWWFAEGVGIVRLRSNYSGIFSREMSLARP